MNQRIKYTSKDYLDNISKVKQIIKDSENREKIYFDTCWGQKRKIQDEIDILKDKINDLGYGESRKREEIKRDKEKNLAPLWKINGEIEKIINILNFKYKPVDSIEEKDIDKYSSDKNHFLELQEYFINKEYIKIRFVISENRKPVNKYSLCIIGKCSFHEDFLSGLMSYGLPFVERNCNITRDLGSYKSIEDARIKMQKLLKNPNFFGEELEKIYRFNIEFSNIINTYKLSDFKEIVYWKCSYCRSSFDEKLETHTNIAGDVCDTPLYPQIGKIE